MVKIVKGKIGPKEQATRALREQDDGLSIPPFLKRVEDPVKAAKRDAKYARPEVDPKLKVIEPYNPNDPIRKAIAKDLKDDPKHPATGDTQESDMRTSAVKKTSKKAPAKTAKPKVNGKAAAKANARTPVRGKGEERDNNLRDDGLRVGSGMAILVDTVCRKQGATNEELCKAVGWKQCLPMMRKACERAKVKLRVEKKEGEPTRYFGTR